MSKVYEILKKSECDRCVNRKSFTKEICKQLDDILEANKHNINFVFDFNRYGDEEYKKIGNKYGKFINKYKQFDDICLYCCWDIVKKYNDNPLGEIIYCYN